MSEKTDAQLEMISGSMSTLTADVKEMRVEMRDIGTSVAVLESRTKNIDKLPTDDTVKVLIAERISKCAEKHAPNGKLAGAKAKLYVGLAALASAVAGAVAMYAAN
jgi:hypothetical protein